MWIFALEWLEGSYGCAASALRKHAMQLSLNKLQVQLLLASWSNMEAAARHRAASSRGHVAGAVPYTLGTKFSRHSPECPG